MFAGKCHELWQPLNRAVVIHKLRQQADRGQPRQGRQIGTCLGMTRTHQNPALTRHQGEDVTWAHEVVRADIAVRQRLGSGRAFLSRDACGKTFFVIDRYGKGSAHRSIVARNHGIQVQFYGLLLQNRRT